MFKTFSFNERLLKNGKYRYDGSFYGIRYSIESVVKRSKEDIEEYLESKKTYELIKCENFIVEI